MISPEKAAVLLQGGHFVLLRVPRRASAAELVRGLMDQGLDAVVVEQALPLVEGRVRVLDARLYREADFEGWDVQREILSSPSSPLLVLLDVASGTSLLRTAPHLVSWAGGVWMVAEPTVRPAHTEEELELGRAALRRALAEDESFRVAHMGQTVAVDLLTGRLFAGGPDGGALQEARIYLDEGTVFLERLVPDA